ncbi:hypothetical protein [uncultured Psychrosphaera sp.]|uniref:hypothetical protein n=1 Tax=uncultured Psychrosphaera sp. TaxID=1403522 RepID=UPI00262EE75C|nr:hypothetical protein [uncultured Psychrosphaera sp.]
MDLVKFQNDAYPAIQAYLDKHPTFAKYNFKICYCTNLVLNDLSTLKNKKHFNWDAEVSGSDAMYMEGESPLKFAIYTNNLPVGYVLGRIDPDTCAFEIFYTEVSNFYTFFDKCGWIRLIIDILSALKICLETADTSMVVDKIVQINPVPSTISNFVDMGFEYDASYTTRSEGMVLNLHEK